MLYKKVAVTLSPYNEIAAQLLIDTMGNQGFESFVETPNGFDAYIQADDWTDSTMRDIKPEIPGIRMTWTLEDVPDQDWNAQWEQSGYTPISINNGQCVIHGPATPPQATELDVIIDPKNAFGSGHHETTRMIVSTLLSLNLNNASVLDMGCGTGVLGIIAALRGASHVDAVDIDNWSVQNTTYNATLNGVADKVAAIQGTSDSLNAINAYDLLIANIFREIIIASMPAYANATKRGGTILLSGFLQSDLNAIESAAKQHGLIPVKHLADNDWRMCVIHKP